MSRFPRNQLASDVAEILDRLITLEPPQNGRRLPAFRGVPPDGVGRLSGTARRRVPALSLREKPPLRVNPEQVKRLTLLGCSLNVFSIIRIVATRGSAHA
jgi:hypothetical protein